MNHIADLPVTPRQAFEAMTGKRPDCFISATRGDIFAGVTKISTRFGTTLGYVVVCTSSVGPAHIVWLGGNN